MDKPAYYASATKDIIKQDIAYKVIETANWVAKVKVEYRGGNLRWKRSLPMLLQHFTSLFMLSCVFVEASSGKTQKKKLDKIREALDTRDPERVINAFQEYLRMMKSSKLIEIGWETKSFAEKMVVR